MGKTYQTSEEELSRLAQEVVKIFNNLPIKYRRYAEEDLSWLEQAEKLGKKRAGWLIVIPAKPGSGGAELIQRADHQRNWTRSISR